MKPDVPRWAHWMYYLATLVALGYAVHAIHALMRDEEDNSEAQSLMWIARFCQKVAETFGTWGLHAEVAYKELMEERRMN